MKRKTNIPVLAQYFNENFAHISYKELQHLNTSDNIIFNAAKYLFSSSEKKNRNLICQILKRNTGRIKDLLVYKNEKKNEVPTRSSKQLKFLIAVKRVVKELKISRSDIFESYYHSCSVYSRLCIKLGMKNSVKNRKQLNTFFIRKVESLSQKMEPICSPNKLDQGLQLL